MPLTLRSELPPAVVAARSRRAEGWTIHAIADDLGLTYSRVWTLLTGIECEDCGRFTAGQKGSRKCRQCSKVKWTREDVRLKIARFYMQFGRTPGCNEFDSLDGADGAAARRLFGSYNDAVAAAGFRPNPRGTRFSSSKAPRSNVRIDPTVENGFTAEDELKWLTAEQAKDSRNFILWHPSLDALQEKFNRGGFYTDAWTRVVHAVIDRRREIDGWAENVGRCDG